MLCATASRRTCSSAVPILESSTRFWVTTSWIRQRAIRASPPALLLASRARSTGCRSLARSPGRAGKTSRRHSGPRLAPSSVGGCGYLPPPWNGVARGQCRPCQPRPTQGDVGDRELPHGSARRPCCALRERELRLYADRL